MRQQFRLGRGGTGELVAQGSAHAAVQYQAPALQQILISSVLNERMLEAIVRIWWQALHQEDVGIGEPDRAACSGVSSIPATVRSSA